MYKSVFVKKIVSDKPRAVFVYTTQMGWIWHGNGFVKVLILGWSSWWIWYNIVQFPIYLGLKGDPNFADFVIFCFGVEILLYKLI